MSAATRRPARALATLLLLAGVVASVLGGCSAAPTDNAPVDQISLAPVGPTGGSGVTERERTGLRVRACEGPAESLPAVFAARLPAAPAPAAFGEGGTTIDDFFSSLARRVPGGFAGVRYLDGRPVLMLVDPARVADAKAALAPAFVGMLRGFELAAAEPRAVRWDFAQLYDWKRWLYARGVWARELGVTVADLDEASNRVYFGAADAAARDRLAAWLGALEGVPCDLVLVGVSPPASLL